MIFSTDNVLLYLMIGAVSTAIAAYTWNFRKIPGALPFLIATAAMACRSYALAFFALSRGLTEGFVLVKTVFVFTSVTPVASLAMALQMTGRERLLTKRNLVLWSMPLLGVFLWIAVNPPGTLRWLWKDFLYAGGNLKVVFGPAYYLYLGYCYLFIVAAVGMFLERYIGSAGLIRRQAGMMIIVLLTVFASHALHVFFASPVVASFLITLGMILDFLALFQMRLFDILPAAQAVSMEKTGDGLLVLDMQGHVIAMNSATESLFQVKASQCIGRLAIDVLAGKLDLMALAAGTANVSTTIRIDLQTGPKYVAVVVHSLTREKGKLLGMIVVLHDLTLRKQTLDQVSEQEKALIILREREYLARELHDHLCQVLAYINTQAQTIHKLNTENDRNAVAESLERLGQVSSEAYDDAREFIRGVKAIARSDDDFIASLREYVRKYEAINRATVRLVVGSNFDPKMLDPVSQVQLVRIIQEALTNIRKHARSREIRISIGSDHRSVRALIEDDGVGFDADLVERGFGLVIMRDRARESGGTLRVESSPGLGTKVIVEFPKQSV